jgi:hypothetical protein
MSLVFDYLFMFLGVVYLVTSWHFQMCCFLNLGSMLFFTLLRVALHAFAHSSGSIYPFLDLILVCFVELGFGRFGICHNSSRI